MNEVDFSGWIRTEMHLHLIRMNPKYRRRIHWQRFKAAVKQRRWHYFTWWNIKGLLLNQTEQF